MVRTVSALLALLALLATGPAAAEKKGLTIEGPPVLTGDGHSSVILTVLGKRLTQIKVTVDAGRVGEVQTTPQGATIELVPPHVVKQRWLTVKVTAKAGKRKAMGKGRFLVEPPDVEPGTNTSQGPLALTGPTYIVLGQQKTAVFTFQRPTDEMPQVKVSSGTTSGIAETTLGRLTFTYTVADVGYPHVVVVAVTSGVGELLDWLAVPAFGQAEVETETEKNASVTVTVGNIAYGPVRADAKGRARLSIVVPPGVKEARAVGSDSLGNEKKDLVDLAPPPVDLAPPPFNRLLLLCPKGADRLQIIVVDEAGRPTIGQALELTASAGTLNPVTMPHSGVYESLIGLPEDVPVGETVRFGAVIPDAPTSAGECGVRVTGGPPAKVVVTFDADAYTAGSSVIVAVTTMVTDSGGRPAHVKQLTVAADVGEVNDNRQVGPGQYRATWKLPDAFDGRSMGRVAARAGHASAEANIALRHGRLAQLEIRTDQRELRADGKTTVQLAVWAADTHGNPVPDLRLQGLGRGELSDFAYSDRSGAFEATYTTPLSYERLAETVTIRPEGSNIESTLELDLAPHIRTATAGVKVGYAGTSGRFRSPVIAADVAGRLPLANDSISFGFEAGFLWQALPLTTTDGEKVDTSLWVVPLLVQAIYELRRFHPLGFYAGPNVGLAVIGRTVEATSAGETSAIGAHLAFGGRLGTDVVFGPGRIFAELAYLKAEVTDPNLRGVVGGLSGCVGFRFEL